MVKEGYVEVSDLLEKLSIEKDEFEYVQHLIITYRKDKSDR
jgi:hypothetical protein